MQQHVKGMKQTCATGTHTVIYWYTSPNKISIKKICKCKKLSMDINFNLEV